MAPDQKTAWMRKLDEECPFKVVLPRRQLLDDSEIMEFLGKYVGKFDMYVEDDYAIFVRFCFEDPLDAEIFKARFAPKVEGFKLAGRRVIELAFHQTPIDWRPAIVMNRPITICQLRSVSSRKSVDAWNLVLSRFRANRSEFTGMRSRAASRRT